MRLEAEPGAYQRGIQALRDLRESVLVSLRTHTALASCPQAEAERRGEVLVWAALGLVSCPGVVLVQSPPVAYDCICCFREGRMLRHRVLLTVTPLLHSGGSWPPSLCPASLAFSSVLTTF